MNAERSRRGPLWQRWLAIVGVVIAFVGITALMIGGLGTIQHHSAAERFVLEVGPLEPEKYAPEPVPDLENATRWIQKGLDEIKFQDDGVGKQGDRHWLEECAIDGPQVIPADQLPKVRASLARNEGAFADIEKAIALPKANWNIPYEDGVSAKVPNLLLAIRTGKTLACDARLAIAAGDAPRAVRRIETLGRMATTYENEPGLLLLLIGVAIERYQLLAVRELLASPTVPPEALLAVEGALSGVPLRERWRRSVAAEAAAIHRTFQRTGTPEGHEQAGKWERMVGRAVWRIAGPWWMSDQLNRAADAHAAMAKSDVPVEAVEEAIVQRRSAWARVFPDFTPNVASGLKRTAAAETQRRLARVAIGLRLTGLVAGRYPASLDPPSTPEDDLYSGKPFVWTLDPKGSARLAAPGTAKDAKTILVGGKEEWWTFELPSPRPPVAPAAPSPTTPGPPDTSPSPPPPAQTPPS